MSAHYRLISKWKSGLPKEICQYIIKFVGPLGPLDSNLWDDYDTKLYHELKESFDFSISLFNCIYLTDVYTLLTSPSQYLISMSNDYYHKRKWSRYGKSNSTDRLKNIIATVAVYTNQLSIVKMMVEISLEPFRYILTYNGIFYGLNLKKSPISFSILLSNMTEPIFNDSFPNLVRFHPRYVESCWERNKFDVETQIVKNLGKILSKYDSKEFYWNKFHGISPDLVISYGSKSYDLRTIKMIFRICLQKISAYDILKVVIADFYYIPRLDSILIFKILAPLVKSVKDSILTPISNCYNVTELDMYHYSELLNN